MPACDDRISRSVLAWHEAGHVVVGTVTGGIVRRVYVADGGGCCLTAFRSGTPLVDELALYYAGAAAEQFGMFRDGGLSSSDAAHLHRLTAHLPAARRSSILAAAERRAVEIVTQHLPAVAHLAHALTCVGNLDQDQVDEILAQHGL